MNITVFLGANAGNDPSVKVAVREFAPKGKGPQRPWIMEHNGERSDFWRETDTWQWMSHVGNFSDNFLTWYTGECGCEIPDMERILARCPMRG